MNRTGPLWALVLSGGLGFWLGIAARPSWHTPIETAQVLAGLVTYPPDNPFFIYHVKLWSVMHELLAAALSAGVSEVTLSRVMSGLVGMLSFQALSGVVYAFSRSAWHATAAAFVIFISRAAEFAGVYPIHLMGTSHTYGVVGLSTSVLVAALLGNGMFRAGGLLLGLAPALHPGMGLWTIVIVTVAIVLGGRRREELRSIGLPFAVGCVLSGIAYAAHAAMTPSVPAIASGAADEYLKALLRYWDGHRRPAHLNNAAVWINAGLLPFAVVWATRLRHVVPGHAQLILRFLLVASSLSLVFTFASWLPRDMLPAAVQILMPLRLLNVCAMTAPALAFGLVGLMRRNWAGQILGLSLTAGLLVSLRSDLWPLLPGGLLRDVTGPIFDLRIDALLLMAGCLVAVTILWLTSGATPEGRFGSQSRGPYALGAIQGGLVLAVLLVVLPALRNRDPVVVQYRDRSHDPFFFTVASERGMLVTGNALRLIQLRTRRPVLVDGGGLDGLAYSLDAGPALNRILRDVYGVDLLNPPADGEGMWGGAIPPAANRAAWERYDVDRWRQIRRAYGATQVLTHSDWKLNLPVRSQTAELTLYQIPD